MALERRNLTQKAIAYELEVASWSTVSKFFNRKPVDRANFIAICQTLNLDWKDIAAVPTGTPDIPEELQTTTPPPDENPSPLTADIEIVERKTQRARKALDPYILPRVPRDALREKCLKLIRAGVLENKRRIVPILGSAGYGKSTILGAICDELQREIAERGTGWIALARCDDFIESAETFALELGEKISDRRQPITEIARQLTAQRGRGILLIDTLDIVLTKPLVPVLRGILSQLLETGTTVAFTCRDADYSNFFEPYHESFAGFRESVQDGCKIPPFNDSEVAAAAREFARLHLSYLTPEGQQTFAGQILALSADSISLQEIVRNPLLLALLCELFAQGENVPEDMTVSQLYEKYWDWKIAKVRHNLQSPHLSRAKERLCLKIAEFAYSNSTDRLRDFIYETSLELGETEYAACEALKSDGILKDFGGKRIGFFHQTFLEYTIARWLNSTESGESAKTQLTREIGNSHTGELKYYIWSVFRQLLTLVSLREFFNISETLDKTQILPFRSLAFASVSRSETNASKVLLSLLEIALSKDYPFHEALLVAANSAPRRHGETVWQVTVRLLEKVGPELINKACEIAAAWLARDSAAGGPFRQAVSAIKNRPAPGENSEKDRHHVWGQFLAAYCERAQTRGLPADLEILTALKENYSLLGSKARAGAIELYMMPGVPEKAQQEFIMELVSLPLSASGGERKTSAELLNRLLPNMLKSGNTVFGSTWWEALHAPVEHWALIVAEAAGRQAGTDANLAEKIVGSLFQPNQSETPPDFNRRNLIAITEAARTGGADTVASLLLKIPSDSVPANRISPLSALLREMAGESQEKCRLAPEMQLSLAEWAAAVAPQHPVELIRAIDALAFSEPVRQRLGELLEKLLPSLPQQQAAQILKKLKHIPLQLQPYLERTAGSKESRAALLKVYQERAEAGSDSAISKLVEWCGDNSREVALDASWAVLKLAQNRRPIDPTQLLQSFAGSREVGVRQNGLKAFIELVNAGRVSQEEILAALARLAGDSAGEVIQLLYKLADSSIWNHPSGSRAIDPAIAGAAFELTRQLIERDKKVLDMAAQPAFITLNQLANLEDSRLVPQISESARALLRKVDISGKLDKQTVTGLLSKLAKFDTELLGKIVREDFIRGEEIMPAGNQVAVAVAISHEGGKNSPFLEEILNNPKIYQEVKTRILRELGI
jgi:hypothetical protein